MERVSFRYDVRSAAGSGPAGSCAAVGRSRRCPCGPAAAAQASRSSGRVLAARGLSRRRTRWLSRSSRRRCGRQPVLLPQPFLRKLLHGLAFLVRRRRVLPGGFFSPGRETIGLTGCLGSTNRTPRGSDSSDWRGGGGGVTESAEELAVLAWHGFCLCVLVVPERVLAVASTGAGGGVGAGLAGIFCSTSGSGRFGFNFRCQAPAGGAGGSAGSSLTGTGSRFDLFNFWFHATSFFHWLRRQPRRLRSSAFCGACPPAGPRPCWSATSRAHPCAAVRESLRSCRGSARERAHRLEVSLP